MNFLTFLRRKILIWNSCNNTRLSSLWGRTNREGALLHDSCIIGSYYSGGRTNQGGRSNRGSTVCCLRNAIFNKYQVVHKKILMNWSFWDTLQAIAIEWFDELSLASIKTMSILKLVKPTTHSAFFLQKFWYQNSHHFVSFNFRKGLSTFTGDAKNS